jgi:hypothetical protein
MSFLLRIYFQQGSIPDVLKSGQAASSSEHRPDGVPAIKIHRSGRDFTRVTLHITFALNQR